MPTRLQTLSVIVASYRARATVVLLGLGLWSLGEAPGYARPG